MKMEEKEAEEEEGQGWLLLRGGGDVPPPPSAPLRPPSVTLLTLLPLIFMPYLGHIQATGLFTEK